MMVTADSEKRYRDLIGTMIRVLDITTFPDQNQKKLSENMDIEQLASKDMYISKAKRAIEDIVTGIAYDQLALM